MKKTLFIVFLAALGITGCKKAQKSDNPFFNTYNTPFEVPPFEKIKAAHYMPAYLKGFEEQKKEIKTIINNPKEPTFENTIKELEYSGELLSKVSRVFGFLGQIWKAALPFAKAEAAAQQEMIKREGGKFKLEPWDWWYYTEKIKNCLLYTSP